MKYFRLLFAVLSVVCLAAGAQVPTGFLSVSSVRLLDASGVAVPSATVCAQAMANNSPQSINVGGGGVTTLPAVCAHASSGSWTLNLPDGALSNPLNMGFLITATDDVSGDQLLNGYTQVQPHSQTCSVVNGAVSCVPNLATDWCQANGCNFDKLQIRTTPNALIAAGIQGRDGPSGCNGAGCTGNFNPSSLNGYEVHVQRYGAPGATGNVQLAAADTAWAGSTSPLKMVFDGPVTFDGPYTTVSGHSLEFHGKVTLANATARLTLMGNQSVSCAPGTEIAGPSSQASGYQFLYATSGSNFVLGENCIVHDMERFVHMPKGVSDVRISRVPEFYNLYSLAFLGDGATTGALAPDQPTRIEFSHIRGHDSQLGLDDYYSHSVHSSDVDCRNIGLYCITGSGGDAAGYVAPDGSASEMTADHITCYNLAACVFYDRITNFEIGGSNYANGTSDMGFDCEDCSNGVIHHAICYAAGTGCVRTLFGGSNIVVSDIMSPDSGIAAANSSQNAGLMTNFLIKDSTVAGVLVESGSNIELSNIRSSRSISFANYHNGLYVHDLNVQINYAAGATDKCMICVSTSSGGNVDRFARNYAQASGAVPSALAMFDSYEANFNNSLNAQLQDNTAAPGIPVFLRADSNGGNGGIYPVWHLHFNHRGGAKLVNTNTNGRGSISEDSVYDQNEQLHIIGAQPTAVP